jgi:hypothetical protein
MATAHAAPVRQEPPPTAPTPDRTPVVDPLPLPLPIFLPSLLCGVDRAQPPPLTPEYRGFVAALLRSGRQACAPATHVLLVDREGKWPNAAVAVLYTDPDRPDLNLDLYVSDFVVVSGLEDVAPDACQEVARRILEVSKVEVVPVPPGQFLAAPASPVGTRTSTAME